MNIEAANRAQASREVCISIAASKSHGQNDTMVYNRYFSLSVFDLTRPRWVVRFLGRGLCFLHAVSCALFV